MESSSSNIYSQVFQPTPLLKEFLNNASKKLVRDKEFAKYPTYQKHFPKTQEAICRAAEGLGKTACILGVGAAQDIPLKELAHRFDKICLVDIDTLNTKKSIQDQVPEELWEKFQIEEADCSGIMEELSVKAEEIAAKHLNHADFVKEVLELLPTLTKKESNYHQEKYSFVCSAQLGSQLGGHMLRYLMKLSKKMYNLPFYSKKSECPKNLNDIMIKLQKDHIKELSQLADSEGTVYFSDHFSVKGLVHAKSEVENVVQELGEQFFPGAQKLQEVVGKRFQVQSVENWGWGYPFSSGLQKNAAVVEENGIKRSIDVFVREFRIYQISSYVLKNAKNLEKKI